MVFFFFVVVVNTDRLSRKTLTVKRAPRIMGAARISSWGPVSRRASSQKGYSQSVAEAADEYFCSLPKSIVARRTFLNTLNFGSVVR
jgi:hypothetical protein